MVKRLLTIAGSDCSGGAGVQADIKTFSALGAYAMSVICSITAQNTHGVQEVFDIPAHSVKAQLESVFSDIMPDAVKIGMVSSAENINVISGMLDKYHPEFVVLDPVMVSTSGRPLLADGAANLLKERLIPRSYIVMPNIPEAYWLSGIEISCEAHIKSALLKIQSMGAENVLIKGGHLSGPPIDYLLSDDKIYTFSSERVNTKNTHGTGCTLSSAVAVFLAKGEPVAEAVSLARQYLIGALENAYDTGTGAGAVNHFWNYSTLPNKQAHQGT